MDLNNDILLSIKVNRVIPNNCEDVLKFLSKEEYEKYTKLTDQMLIDNSLPESLSKNWKFLPQQINRSYLGESIDFFVLLTNDSIKEDVSQVDCKVILENPNDQFVLNELKSDQLTAKQSLNSIVKHELKCLGKYQLICSVTYKVSTNEIKTFKTKFQFVVEKPLDVKTKFYFDDLTIDDIYLEATLQNTSMLPICLESVYLEPIKSFEVIDMNHIEKENGKKCLVFGEINRFNNDDIRLYLFCLKIKKKYLNDLSIISQISNVGKLNIIWTSSTGIKGHLQTPQLSLEKKDYDDLQFSIKEVPEQTILNQKFTIKLSCTNYSGKDMEPCLYFDNKDTATQSVLWLGISGTKLPKIQPTQSITFEMTAYPVECGIQVVPLIRIEDVLNNNKAYTFKEKIYVNVLNNQ